MFPTLGLSLLVLGYMSRPKKLRGVYEKKLVRVGEEIKRVKLDLDMNGGRFA